MKKAWSVGWRIAVVLWLAVCVVEGVAASFSLMNYPDDFAVIGGVFALVVSVVVPTAVGVVVLPWRSGKQDA